MKSLNAIDIFNCARRIPYFLKYAMKKNPGKIIVGGGFVRSVITGDKINDVDVFVASENAAHELSRFLSKKYNSKPYVTKNAITIPIANLFAIQIIHRWVYDKPEKILTDFDFTVCCAIIYYSGAGVTLHGFSVDTYYQDLAARRLVYTSPTRDEEAGGSLLRVLKYYEKGYRIGFKSLSSVMARIVLGTSMVKNDTHEYDLSNSLSRLLIEVDPNAFEALAEIDEKDTK